MATIKSYTDLSQSKTLSKILPLESADMCYIKREINDTFIETPIVKPIGDVWKSLPCWSLAALLGVLPKGTNIGTPCPIEEHCCCWNQYDEIYADNPIDACYEMIIKLKELDWL